MKTNSIYRAVIFLGLIHAAYSLHAVQTRSKKSYGYYDQSVLLPISEQTADTGQVIYRKSLYRKRYRKAENRKKHLPCPYKNCDSKWQSRAHLLRHYESHYPYHYCKPGIFRSRASILQMLRLKKSNDTTPIYEDKERKAYVMNILTEHIKNMRLAKRKISRIRPLCAQTCNAEQQKSSTAPKEILIPCSSKQENEVYGEQQDDRSFHDVHEYSLVISHERDHLSIINTPW